MADLPRDPRQLARDILAGKISIEDLAREQARRRSGQAPSPQASPTSSREIKTVSEPLRRPTSSSGSSIPAAQPMPVQASRTPVAARPFPPRPAQQPQRPRQQTQQPSRPRGPLNVQVRPLPTSRQPPRQGTAQPFPSRAGTNAVSPSLSASGNLAQQLASSALPPQSPTPATARQLPLQAQLRNPANLRRAIILSEILSKPIALREDF